MELKIYNLKIGIVEDNPGFIEQFKTVIGQNMAINEFSSWDCAEDCLDSDLLSCLDLIFIDINLPGMSGIELVHKLHHKSPRLKKLMLTQISSEDKIVSAIRNGALGYLLKSEIGDVNHIIQIVMKGGAMITPTIALKVFNLFKNPVKANISEMLTSRENEVLEQLTTGLTVDQVAEALNISRHTSRFHIRNIYKKLDVSNRVGLMNIINNKTIPD